jgi:hypothetical protein
LACINVLLVQELNQSSTPETPKRARLIVLEIEVFGGKFRVAMGSGGRGREKRQAVGRESYEPVFAL